jgi:para-aminobenzoate synthetase component 1
MNPVPLDWPETLDSNRLKAVLHHAEESGFAVYLSHSPGEHSLPLQDNWNGVFAYGVHRKLVHDAHWWQHMDAFISESSLRVFGHLGYDLRCDLERLSTNLPDSIGFPVAQLVEPLVLIRRNEHKVWVLEAQSPEMAQLEAQSLNNLIVHAQPEQANSLPQLKAVLSRKQYLSQVAKLKAHIARGDVYEANFCMAFEGNASAADPTGWFAALEPMASAPFAAYYHLDNHIALCFSPERFLQRKENILRSWPIKGTAPRSPIAEVDARIAAELAFDPKEQNENVMVVDVVRNDLSRVATKGSVQVEKLFGVQTFKTVHQLVSEVACEVMPGKQTSDCLAATFPMASMTGAPKIRAMELLEFLESTRRGLYSGSIGWVDSNGDMDWNVVIRTLQLNLDTGNASLMVGSAITYACDPEQEYTECLLKAKLFGVSDSA